MLETPVLLGCEVFDFNFVSDSNQDSAVGLQSLGSVRSSIRDTYLLRPSGCGLV